MSAAFQVLLASQPFSYAANLSSSIMGPSAGMVTGLLSMLGTGLGSAPTCKCLPEDPCWPAKQIWDSFNSTVGGRLIATVPIGSPCHVGSLTSYDNTECTELKGRWLLPDTHWQTSSSIMTNYFANGTCSPFTDANTPCTLGGYVSYAVNATGADDYRKTINFAKQHNIRIVIRNTGHDYYGKSTGAGAIAIWTHFLKDIEFKDYTSPHWTGKAVKMGAGVQAQDVNEAAKERGLVVVTGSCPTIAVPGGYASAGGHGPLVSKYGLAADQVLEWEVITAQGEHIVATPQNHADLYWAMTGGGGGSWGVVLSMTAKAHQDQKTSFMNLSFTSEGLSEDVFYDVIGTFITNLQALVDAGGTCLWYLFPGMFTVSPVTAPGVSQKTLKAIFKPTFKKLKSHGITYNHESAESPNFIDGLNAIRAPENVTNMNWGGRLIPRSTVQDQLPELLSAYKNMLSLGAAIAGFAINVRQTRSPNDAPNSAIPAWRDALMCQVFANYYDETNFTLTRINQDIMTTKITPELAKILPHGGNAYLNEGDFQEPNFQKVFYDKNYPKLKAIKKKYDPEDLWYGLTSVGSEVWESQSDGRLCRT